MKKGNIGISYQVSVAILSQLVRYLHHLNIDVSKLFHSLDLDPELLKYPDAQIPVETYLAVENEAIRVSEDPYFGLHMGEFAEPGNYSVLGYLMMNSFTLGEALVKAHGYFRIMGDLLTPVYRLGPRSIKIILTAPKGAPVFSRHCFEAAFTTQLTMMRKLTGCNIDPISVSFIEKPLVDITEYQRVFACPVHFGQKNNHMVLGNDLGNIPILQPNPELLAFLEKYARTLMSTIDSKKSTSGETSKAIVRRLGKNKVTIKIIARDLAMSVRTLQNRLMEEGVSFSGLYDRTRTDLAYEYLHENLSIQEISLLLGFSESCTFYRAFKKWTGTTPGESRAALKNT